MLPAHFWLIAGLCALPLLIWLPLWLGDVDRPPDNGITHEQDGGRRDPPWLAWVIRASGWCVL